MYKIASKLLARAGYILQFHQWLPRLVVHGCHLAGPSLFIGHFLNVCFPIWRQIESFPWIINEVVLVLLISIGFYLYIASAQWSLILTSVFPGLSFSLWVRFALPQHLCGSDCQAQGLTLHFQFCFCNAVILELLNIDFSLLKILLSI